VNLGVNKASFAHSTNRDKVLCSNLVVYISVTYFCAPFKIINTMNRYETVFIMTPVLSADQVAETVKKYQAAIATNGGKILYEDAWGLRKLAYPIQKKSTGFYHLIEWEAPGTAVQPFETEFRRDERILRFLTTAMDKHHIAYAESRRDKSNRKAEPKAEATVEATAPAAAEAKTSEKGKVEA
jgi:small subunit ribosomal protein S6